MHTIMVTAETYVLNEECALNNKVLRVSLYYFVIRGKCVNENLNDRETYIVW